MNYVQFSLFKLISQNIKIMKMRRPSIYHILLEFHARSLMWLCVTVVTKGPKNASKRPLHTLRTTKNALWGHYRQPKWPLGHFRPDKKTRSLWASEPLSLRNGFACRITLLYAKLAIMCLSSAIWCSVRQDYKYWYFILL